METAVEVSKNLVDASPITLALLIALAAIAVCGFALWVVHKNGSGKH